LRKNFSQYQQRIELCNSFDLFLADDRILPMLPKALGAKFFEKKKQPIPVNLKSKDIAGPIKAVCHSTFFFLGYGVTSSVKVGPTDFDVEMIVANIMAALKGVAEAVPKKWKNIQSIHLKTTNSIALPLYNSLPTVDDDEEEVEEKKESKKVEKKETKKVEKEDATPKSAPTKVTGKKRPLEDTTPAAASPTKRAKTEEKKAVVASSKRENVPSEKKSVESVKKVVTSVEKTAEKKPEKKKVVSDNGSSAKKEGSKTKVVAKKK
jgi:ribosome biogenesis protein UTP30